MIKVSVIIPIYNSDKYIRRCIESIRHQTLRDIEIICIDDCSIDQSIHILHEYVQKDNRIKVFHNDINLGAAICRNRALDLARGKYIQFVDSDDYLDEETLEKMYDYAEEKKLDMCFLKMRVIHENQEIRYENNLGIKESYNQLYTGKKLLSLFVDKKEFFYYAWMVFYKRNFLLDNQIYYRNITIGEGGDLILRSLAVAEKVSVIDKVYYNYCIRQGSITDNSKKSKLVLFGQIIQYIDMLKCMGLDAESKEIYYFLEYQIRKIKGGINNLSINDRKALKEMLKDKFEEHMFNILLSKSDSENYNIILQSDDLKKIQQSENVILYGAGYAIRDVICLLSKYEIEILGIAVSERKNNPKCLYGHHIYEITELIEYRRNSIIIVTANNRHKKEIEKKIKENGFYRYIFLDVTIS